MPSTQRQPAAALIRRLLEQPYRFEFIQAVRILDAWLGKVVPDAFDRHSRYIRFRNRISLTFPASQVDAIVVDVGDTGECQPTRAPEVRRIEITPAYGGLLGSTGMLPLHYTENLLRARDQQGQRELFDLVSQRAYALQYRAWMQARMVHGSEAQGSAALKQMQLAIAGTLANTTRSVPDDVPAFYSVALRHYACSPQVLEDVLTEYFGVPFKVEQFAGQWLPVDKASQTTLDGSSTLGEGPVLGRRIYSKSTLIVLRIGPLSIDDYEYFLPGSKGAQALWQMVSLFRVAALSIHVQLVLRSTDVRPVVLGTRSRPAFGLGYASLSMTRHDKTRDHVLRYDLAHRGAPLPTQRDYPST